MLSKIWIWDPGSEIQDPEKTYSGSRIQGSKRHRIPDPQHCFFITILSPLAIGAQNGISEYYYKFFTNEGFVQYSWLKL
jgi:hypothetical protein